MTEPYPENPCLVADLFLPAPDVHHCPPAPVSHNTVLINRGPVFSFTKEKGGGDVSLGLSICVSFVGFGLCLLDPFAFVPVGRKCVIGEGYVMEETCDLIGSREGKRGRTWISLSPFGGINYPSSITPRQQRKESFPSLRRQSVPVLFSVCSSFFLLSRRYSPVPSISWFFLVKSSVFSQKLQTFLMCVMVQSYLPISDSHIT